MTAILCDVKDCTNGRDVTTPHPLGAGDVSVCIDHWNSIQVEQGAVVLRKLRVL